ncbi:MFS transporter [Lophium mytilinum]|uniref:MFS transporter n=1 Tax=Lophium mytilinum TaxID=390894 RepID=A0A6A6RAY4_9PEZI|nr:MFS transporter [Lophium mytilinum]
MEEDHINRHARKKLQNLGSIQLRHLDTNEIILIPTPSSNPNDPLNWYAAYRLYIAVLVCFAMFMTNFLAAGPSVAIVSMTESFFGPPGPNMPAHIATTAYLYTVPALCQGMGMLFWMPFIAKYGRRPVYIISFVIYTATAIWCGVTKSYGVELAGRVIMGLASGAGECLGPLTIADIFFLHERGSIMAMYTAALSMGVGGGIVISGLIVKTLSWRYIFYVGTALTGLTTILVIFTFPETTFMRGQEQSIEIIPVGVVVDEGEKLSDTATHLENRLELELGSADAYRRQLPPSRSYLSSLRIFTGTYTSEPLWRIFLRPISLVLLPPVLWASLVMSVTIGFLVAITSNFASAFAATYNFAPWQSGLCFISSIIGSFIAITFGGRVSDWTADWFTKRNGGLREPEMRLPAVVIGGIFVPVALILYGVGINNQLHWMVPTLGLGCLNFAIVQLTSVSLVYTIDCYRPAAGEVAVSQLVFKAAFGFLLSFYTNPWIDSLGYTKAFGSMAGIASVVILFAIPLYFFGKGIRRTTWNWSFVRKFAHWQDDREVGE